jgi:hypothetical protein
VSKKKKPKKRKKAVQSDHMPPSTPQIIARAAAGHRGVVEAAPLLGSGAMVEVFAGNLALKDCEEEAGAEGEGEEGADVCAFCIKISGEFFFFFFFWARG